MNTFRYAVALAGPLCGQGIPTSETLPGLLALVDVLLAAGWIPPGAPAPAAPVLAGRASGARRRGIQSARRIWVERILQRLPAQHRRHPCSLETIDRVHQGLQRLGNSALADNSVVLQSFRRISTRSIAEDLRQISLTANRLTVKTRQKRAR
jgi:hypothetical protein